MSKNFKFKNYKEQILYYFYNITHMAEQLPLNIKRFLKNEKKEFSKIIKAAWIKYDLAIVSKAAFIGFLFLWIALQAKYVAQHIDITYREYLDMVEAVEKITSLTEVQEETLKQQHEKMNQMVKTINKYKANIGHTDAGTAAILLVVGCTAGIIIGGIIASISSLVK